MSPPAESPSVPDPLFDVVAVRHRDVDVVLLQPPESYGPRITEVVALRVLAQVEACARELGESVFGPDVEPVVRLSYGETPDSVRAEADYRVTTDSSVTMLTEIEQGLLVAGWEVSGPSTGARTVRARRHCLAVTALALDPPGVVIVRVSSPTMRTGVERAHALTWSGGR